MSECSSVMSHTTVTPSQVSAAARSQVSAAPSIHSKVSVAKSTKTDSVAPSGAPSGTTVVLKRQLKDLEKGLRDEREARQQAQAEVTRAAKELDALEKLLKLKSCAN